MTKAQVITRFAPSPTGFLHVGNVRTALINWLYSRAQGGKFILRIDDTDTERSKDEYVEGIKRDLTWLGLTWDSMEYQSKRLPYYEEAKQRLITSGRLYPCYESPEELELKRKALLGRNLPPIYDRAALKLTTTDKAEFEAKGIKPHWRFLLADKQLAWTDQVRGEISFQARDISDPILIRADGSMTYMLASVVDDVEMRITHIIRGEDHITNSAIQVQMFEALGATPPSLGHVSLLRSDSAGISKRTGGFDIHSLRQQDIEAMAINSFLSKLGTSDPISARKTLEEVISDFDIHKFGKAVVNYDPEDLLRINTKLLHELDYSKAAERFKELDIEDVDEDFWYAVRPNLHKLTDIKEWLEICKQPFAPHIELQEKDFLKQAIEMLPKGQWDNTTWHQWMESLKNTTGRSGKNLFMPLRKALTAKTSGPELAVLILLLGRDKVIARLQGDDDTRV
jgi:glutamyl-tRNA synthetase